MSYKIPAKVIRNVIKWGRNHSYNYESFIKTIKKEDLIKFYSLYRDRSYPELKGTKKMMFEQIEKYIKIKL